MRLTFRNLFACILGACSVQALAAPTTVDFIGTVEFFGPFANLPSGGLAPLPLEYHAPSDIPDGETVVGWFRYETNPGAYASITGTPGIQQAYNAAASPTLTAFEFSFPTFDYTITSAQLPALVPRMLETLKQSVTVLNAGHVDVLSVSSRWDTTWGGASGGRVQGSIGAGLRDNTATALDDSSLPVAPDISRFDVTTAGLSDIRSCGFNQCESLLLEVGDLQSPSAAVGLASGALKALGVFEAKSSSGGIVGWTVSDTGTVDIVDLAGGNSVAHLTTGSPVSIARSIATPDSAFELLLDFQFLSTTGTLGILLDGSPLASIAAPDALSGAFDTFALAVTDPFFRNLAGAQLQFILDGLVPGEIYLDNISAQSIQAVPLPAALWLFASGVLVLRGFPRWRDRVRIPVEG